MSSQGVITTAVGFSNGLSDAIGPSYEEVSTGQTHRAVSTVVQSICRTVQLLVSVVWVVRIPVRVS